MENRLDPALLKRTFTFMQYLHLVDELVREGKTTGPKQSEALASYTKLNFQRLKRISKTLELTDKIKDLIKEIESDMRWIVIVEAWCGDGSQNLPYFNAISQLSDRISLEIILRDENPEIMDQFLTNGTRSIPKVICLDPDTYAVAGAWGPRPKGAKELVQSLLNDPSVTKDMRNEAVQRWYLDDKGRQLQEELVLLIRAWDIQLSHLSLRKFFKVG